MNLLPLLLTDPSPSFRLLVLRELLGIEESDSEIQELIKLREKDELFKSLLKNQNTDGSWDNFELVNTTHRSKLSITSFALMRLGYLGFTINEKIIKKGIEYLFSQQQHDGSWKLDSELGKYFRNEDTNLITSVQTSIPLRAIAMCGSATDPRAELSYEWLIEQRNDDGSWPTGFLEGNLRRVGGYRKLAHSKWGCRTNTTSALASLVYHPKYRQSSIVHRALDLLLATRSSEVYNLGYELAKLTGHEKNSGLLTFHYEHDLAFILNLCWRANVSKTDPNITGIIKTVQKCRMDNGLWNYTQSNQVSRFLTFDLLRSLTNLTENDDWISIEPKTPFWKYKSPKERY